MLPGRGSHPPLYLLVCCAWLKHVVSMMAPCTTKGFIYIYRSIYLCIACVGSQAFDRHMSIGPSQKFGSTKVAVRLGGSFACAYMGSFLLRETHEPVSISPTRFSGHGFLLKDYTRGSPVSTVQGPLVGPYQQQLTCSPRRTFAGSRVWQRSRPTCFKGNVESRS